MKEIWKDISGYEGKYQISSLGRVKSLNFQSVKGREAILTPDKSSNYLRITLFDKNNKRTKQSIHRLVALTFIPNPNNYPCVNHIDENKFNNKTENLEWCTHKYNSNYGHALEKTFSHPNTIKAIEVRKKPVQQFDLNGNLIAEYSSITEAAEKSNSDISEIQRVCKEKQKTASKFQWKYKDSTKEIMKIKPGNQKYTYEQFTLDGRYIASYNTVSEIEKALKIKNANGVRNACRGEKLSAYGFQWKYKESNKEIKSYKCKSSAHPKIKEQDYEKIYKMYYIQKMSIKDIAKFYKVHYATILNHLKIINKNN